MRILQVSDKRPDDGGVGRYVALLTEALRTRGHRVEQLLLLRSDAPSDGYTLRPSYGLLQGYRQREDLRRAVRAAQPDVVHVHQCFTTLSPVLLAELQRMAPVVGTIHDVRPFCYLMTRRRTETGAACERVCGLGCFSSGCVRPQGALDVARLARRWLMDGRSLAAWRGLERILAPSRYIAELATQHGIPVGRLRVVPHGVWPVEVMVPAGDAALPLILYAGALVGYKGPQLLLKALARLGTRRWRAVLAGEGPLRAALERDVQRLGLGERVQIIGHLATRTELDRLMASARMLVVPSIIPESFALVGIESLAVGTPVVSFGLGGIAEWFRPGENGLLAKEGDAGDLAACIAQLLDDAPRAQAMGARGRQLVLDRFGEEAAWEAVLAVYREAAAERDVVVAAPNSSSR